MSANEFAMLCEEYGIHPTVALECEAVVKALKNKVSKDRLAKILEENF